MYFTYIFEALPGDSGQAMADPELEFSYNGGLALS
jgi:hypothetical protein